VVFSIPVGDAAAPANLQLVSISETVVDWDQTDRYAEAVHAKRYGDTRGEEDFALLTGRVVEALNIVALTPDPVRRLAMAQEARRNLMQWPAQNFGYRAAEVAQLSSMFDEVIAELRVAAGQPEFDLSLVATTTPAPPVELLPTPGLRESVEQAFNVVPLASDASERESLLRAIAVALEEPAQREEWAEAFRGRASAALAVELRTDKSYRDLASAAIATANARAARADVRGLQAIVQQVLRGDDGLGRQRPQEMAALLAFLDVRLDDSRRLRLARDAWTLRLAAFETYKRAVAPAIDYLRRSKSWLEDVRQLAGPAPKWFDFFEQRVVMGRQALERIVPPAELESVHGLFGAAFQMARRAAATRRTAVSSKDMKLAWDASSAAAGALMLLDRANQEFDRITSPPSHP
jgi:hypothetical protein